MKRSCEICKKGHEHVYWEHNNSGKVRFCKTMVGNFSLRMSIPQKFLSRFRGNLSENIDLKGPGGNIWHVRMAKSASNAFLQHGWKEFVEAHHLEENDILIFTYEGNSCFSVVMFDSSECERESSYFVKNERAERQEATSEDSLKILEPSRTADRVVYDCTSDSSPNIWNIPQESSPSNNGHSGKHFSCSGRDTKKRQRIMSPKPEISGASMLGDQSGNRNSPRKPATDAGRKAAMKLACAFRTNRPSFSTVMKGYNLDPQFQLLIPPEAKEFLPQKSQEMILNVPGVEQEWKVFYRITKTDARFTSKWRNFARDNILKEGDVCKFVLSKGGKKIAMKVHIFRALEL